MITYELKVYDEERKPVVLPQGYIGNLALELLQNTIPNVALESINDYIGEYKPVINIEASLGRTLGIFNDSCKASIILSKDVIEYLFYKKICPYLKYAEPHYKFVWAFNEERFLSLWKYSEYSSVLLYSKQEIIEIVKDSYAE